MESVPSNPGARFAHPLDESGEIGMVVVVPHAAVDARQDRREQVDARDLDGDRPPCARRQPREPRVVDQTLDEGEFLSHRPVRHAHAGLGVGADQVPRRTRGVADRTGSDPESRAERLVLA